MFSAYCKHCGTVVLLDPGCVRSMRNTAAGIVLDFRCYAGHSGVQLVRREVRPTLDAGGPGATAQAVASASPRATHGGPATRRRSWWSRPRGARPRQSCPGIVPRPGGLHAT
jgi:hypothetical protein